MPTKEIINCTVRCFHVSTRLPCYLTARKKPVQLIIGGSLPQQVEEGTG